MVKLCSLTDVNQYIETIGRWEESEIDDTIEFISEEIYDECNVVKSIYSNIDSDYSEYYLGERQVYMIKNILYGDAGSQVRLSAAASEYSQYLTQGIVVLATTTVAANASVAWPEDYIEIEFVPGIFNKYCAARVAQHLLEKSQVVSGESAESSVNMINKIVSRLKQKIMDGIGPVISSDNASYDYEYSINRRLLRQQHNRNKDLLKNR